MASRHTRFNALLFATCIDGIHTVAVRDSHGSDSDCGNGNRMLLLRLIAARSLVGERITTGPTRPPEVPRDILHTKPPVQKLRGPTSWIAGEYCSYRTKHTIRSDL